MTLQSTLITMRIVTILGQVVLFLTSFGTVDSFHILSVPKFQYAISITASSGRSSRRTSSSSPSSLSSTTSGYTLDGKEIRGPITPLGNFIVVKLKDTLQATSGGILLPDQSKERPTEGIVIEAGPGKLHPFTGVRITNPIQKGMNVLFGKYDGSPILYNGEECQMIRDDNVLLSYTGVTMRLDDVVPIRDYVLVKLDDGTSNDDDDNTSKSSIPGFTTSSGIVIASAVMKDLQPCQGIVVKVGTGRMASTGQYTNSPVTVGDNVKFKDYAGNEVQIEGKLYSVVKMVDILCTRRSD